MKVQIVSFHCILKDKFGKIISSSFNQDILTGSDGSQQELAALSKGLQNLTSGEKRKITLSAAEAYGFYDPKKVLTMPRNELPQIRKTKKIEKPIMLEINGRPHQFRVIEVNSDNVVLDGNHPLAGQDLVFEIETVAVRDATPSEIHESIPQVSNIVYH